MSGTEETKFCGDEGVKFEKMTKVFAVTSKDRTFALISPPSGGTEVKLIGPDIVSAGDNSSSLEANLKKITAAIQAQVDGCEDVSDVPAKRRMLAFSHAVIGDEEFETTVAKALRVALDASLPRYNGNKTTRYSAKEFFDSKISTLGANALSALTALPLGQTQYTFSQDVVKDKTTISDKCGLQSGVIVVADRCYTVSTISKTDQAVFNVGLAARTALIATITDASSECVSAAYSATILPLLFAFLCFAMFAQKMF